MSIEAKPGSKRVMIVIEETGPKEDGVGFNVFLEGIDQERLKKISPDQYTTAEHWGMALYRICVSALHQTGAVRGSHVKKT